ncbi:hypothetical protein EX895_002090 [Sporisorium graminicola]|uniref:Uncharacterized protein n=1 Tax=Sporisorium graminicola TaxID=280036 RepID=A0A4V6EU17_9BASI|nr:hypothetical protein EX895_002090 [Sporisorium graminicola]TKY88849.1 hypothetical protein EX895_002090 [Sporisorium graminicola]
MARQGDVKPKASGRASIPTPAVRFPIDDDKARQLTRSKKGAPAGAKSKPSRGFLGWLIAFASRVTIFYLIYAALWTCPSHSFAFDYSAKDARPVCRNLAQAHEQLAPILKPYFHLAQKKAEPYTRPVITAATPWVRRAQKVSRPVYREANKRGRLLWKKRIDPARRRALKRARKQLDPYLKQAHHYHKHNVQPHIDTVHKAVKPYHAIYQRDVSPYVDQAYQYSLHSSSVSYAFYMDKVHPRIVQSFKHVYSFLVNHVDPAVRRFYSVYVRPQLDRLLAKVYERKAHWLGSDAIKTAQQEMKQTAKHADMHAEQAVKKAEQDAIKAQTDPSLLDRIKHAKDAVVDSATGAETDPFKAAQLDAELDAEEEKVKDLLEVWENGMTDLIEKEYKLAVDRLADLRNQRLADLPDRFGLVNEAFVEDTVALILNRVERGLRKISNRSDADAKKKLAAGDELVDQQIARFDEAALDTKVQISNFYEKLLQDERQAIETSSAEVRRYAAAAKEAYDEIMRDAKFAVTMDEWQGWDIGVRKRASLFAEELDAVQSNKKPVSKSSGALDLTKDAPDVQKQINSLRAWADKLHSSARKELIAYCDTALAQLAGQGVAAKVSEVTDRLAEQASRISTDAAAGMLSAVGLARTKLRLGESASDGYLARAKAYVASGSGSGSAFDDYINSLNAKAAAVGDTVASAAAQARSSVVSAVGAASSTPATAAKASAAVADAIGGVAANVRDAASSASSAASKVSRSAASAVGASPTPETVGDYVDDGKDKASAAAGWISGAAQAGASSASSAVSVASQSASVAAGNVGEAVRFGASSASSLASVASSSAAEAVRTGASSASSAASVASRSASSAISDASKAAKPSVSSISSAASSVASAASRSASSALSDASKAAQSGASSASSAASSVSSVASRSGSSAFSEASKAAQSVAATASSAAQSGASSASSLASRASRSVASAVSSVSPSSLASSAASAASSAAAESLSSGSSVLSKASRSVASAVGASPTPETLEDYLEDAKEAVKSVAAKAHIEL